MDEKRDLPSRRGVLALLGFGAMTPAVLALGRSGTSGGGEVDGLRFDVLEAGRHAFARHVRHGVGSPIHHTSWSDVVRVSLRVSNVGAWPLLVSPGQFRVRVDRDLSVMPNAWQHGPAALVAGGARTGWIDFRAPAAGGVFHLEFTSAGRLEPVVVPLVVPGAVA